MEAGAKTTQLDHWQRVGASYDAEWEPPARNRLGERELDFIARGLLRSAARTAMDVGAGNGRILEGLLERSPHTVFHGIDLAPAMVQATRERLGDEPRVAGLAVCDVAHEPLPFEGPFDFISAIRMLKYVHGWHDVVGKLVGHLAPGGVIVFSMENSRSLNAIARPYVVDGPTATLGEIREVCDDLGLRAAMFDGFTKLPHRVYSGVRSTRLARSLIVTDTMLRRLLGGPRLAREIFVVASR